MVSSRRVELENIVLDQIGTDQQSRRELDEKRYHIIANLISLFPERINLGRWRLVIKDTHNQQCLPPVFTVLPAESEIRTEANLTHSLANLRKLNDPRITPEYIRDVLHPIYKNGQLRNQQDLSDYLNHDQIEELTSALEQANQDRKLLIERISDFEDKEALLDQEMSKINYENQVIDLTEPAILENAEVVTIQRQKGPTQYTQIKLSNGLKLLKKWDIAATLAKANSLKGKYVITTVWNKAGSNPTDSSYWKATDWFEDIYEIKNISMKKNI